jgi:hypothetical protein
MIRLRRLQILLFSQTGELALLRQKIDRAGREGENFKEGKRAKVRKGYKVLGAEHTTRKPISLLRLSGLKQLR